jgi:hypothetical protein
MTDFIVWTVGYPLSLLFFVFLGISSLIYNKAKYKTTEDEFQQFISKFRFPLSIYKRVYNNIELRNFVLPRNQNKKLLQVNRFLWAFTTSLCFLALFTTIVEGSLLLRVFWGLVYAIAFPINWRLGHMLR